MGWIFLHNEPNKKVIVEECTREDSRMICIRKSLNGNELWTIWQNKQNNEKVIILFLLRKDDGTWGYKDISEDMGPCYYKCPLSFFDDVPAVNESWRERVRKFNAQKKGNSKLLKELGVGKVVTLRDSNPSVFRVSTLKPLTGFAVSNGCLYKLVKNRIVSITDNPEPVL